MIREFKLTRCENSKILPITIIFIRTLTKLKRNIGKNMNNKPILRDPFIL